MNKDDDKMIKIGAITSDGCFDDVEVHEDDLRDMGYIKKDDLLKKIAFESSILNSPECEADGPRQWDMDIVRAIWAVEKNYKPKVLEKLASVVREEQKYWGLPSEDQYRVKNSILSYIDTEINNTKNEHTKN
jgi:hypothetical protein